MQLGMLKLLTTTGPFAPFGSITSIVPTVRSPVAFPFVTRNMPLLGLKADPPNPTRETAPAQPTAGGDLVAERSRGGEDGAAMARYIRAARANPVAGHSGLDGWDGGIRTR